MKIDDGNMLFDVIDDAKWGVLVFPMLEFVWVKMGLIENEKMLSKVQKMTF